jgi:hypothetical protein
MVHYVAHLLRLFAAFFELAAALVEAARPPGSE